MSVYKHKEYGFEETINLISDENDICTLRRVVTTTNGIGKNIETVIVIDETYRRMPRGTERDRRWQYKRDDGFWFCNDRDVPVPVRQAWIYLAKPIPESKKPKRERQSFSNPVADAAAIAAYWNKVAETAQ